MPDVHPDRSSVSEVPHRPLRPRGLPASSIWFFVRNPLNIGNVRLTPRSNRLRAETSALHVIGGIAVIADNALFLPVQHCFPQPAFLRLPISDPACSSELLKAHPQRLSHISGKKEYPQRGIQGIGTPIALLRFDTASLKAFSAFILPSLALLRSTSAFVTSNFGFVPTRKNPLPVRVLLELFYGLICHLPVSHRLKETVKRLLCGERDLG